MEGKAGSQPAAGAERAQSYAMQPTDRLGYKTCSNSLVLVDALVRLRLQARSAGCSWRLSEFALNVPIRVLEMGELLYGVAFDVLREHCYPDLRVRLGTVTFSI